MAHFSTKSKKSGDMYWLFSKDVNLRGGRRQTIYYFSRDEKNPRGTAIDLPAGYEVMENAKTGLPMLKRAK